MPSETGAFSTVIPIRETSEIFTVLLGLTKIASDKSLPILSSLTSNAQTNSISSAVIPPIECLINPIS